MSSVRFALGSLEGWVSVQIDETPIVSSCNYILCMVSVDAVDMVTALGSGENALNPPAKLDCI